MPAAESVPILEEAEALLNQHDDLLAEIDTLSPALLTQAGRIRATIQREITQRSPELNKLLRRLQSHMADGVELLRLSPLAKTLIQSGHRNLLEGQYDSAARFFRQSITFIEGPPPQPLTRALTTCLLESALVKKEDLSDMADNLVALDQQELQYLFNQLRWLVEDLSTQLGRDPDNGEIEDLLLAYRDLLAKVEPTAKSRHIPLIPRMGDAQERDKQKTELWALPENTAAANVNRTVNAALSLLLFLGIGSLLWQRDNIESYLANQGLLPYAIEKKEDNKKKEDKKKQENQAEKALAAVTGEDKKNVPGLIGKAGNTTFIDESNLPQAREGLSVEQALGKIGEMGVKIPGQPGGPPIPGGSPNAGMLDANNLPEPKAGISMQQALQKVEDMGMKVPGQNSPMVGSAPDFNASISSQSAFTKNQALNSASGDHTANFPSQTGGTFPSQTGGTSVSGVTSTPYHDYGSTSTVSTSGGSMPEPTTFGVTASGNSPQGYSTTYGTNKTASSTGSTSEPSSYAEESSDSNDTFLENFSLPMPRATPKASSKEQQQVARIKRQIDRIDKKPVTLHRNTGRSISGYIIKQDDNQLIFRQIDKKETFKRTISLTDIKRIEAIDQLTLLKNKSVEVILNNGRRIRGILRNYDQRVMHMERALFSGSFSFSLQRNKIREVNPAPETKKEQP
ncbi:hypothetical protein ACQZV8_11390 [Magnetococcales bacterium HHB-1]